jgi:hypothetical protein
MRYEDALRTWLATKNFAKYATRNHNRRQLTQHTTQVFTFLASAASGPYLAMLSTWLARGAVDDPYDEFLVIDDGVDSDALPRSLLATSAASNADDNDDDAARHWHGRYALRRNHAGTSSLLFLLVVFFSNRFSIGAALVPSFLRDVAREALATGSYLATLRQCGAPLPAVNNLIPL